MRHKGPPPRAPLLCRHRAPFKPSLSRISIVCFSVSLSLPSLYLTENELEDVVIDKEVVAVLGQVEDLGELHRPLLLVDLQLAGHEDNDAAADGGLGVEGGVGEVVLDGPEGKALRVREARVSGLSQKQCGQK